MIQRCYWLSNKRMTVLAKTENGIIVFAAPIIRVFVGQPIVNLVLWMKRQPNFRMFAWNQKKLITTSKLNKQLPAVFPEL